MKSGRGAPNRASASSSAKIDQDALQEGMSAGTLEEAALSALKRPVALPSDWNDSSFTGAVCAVYWSDDLTWYYGRLLAVSQDRIKIFVYYDDRTSEWVDCSKNCVKICTGITTVNNWAGYRFWASSCALDLFPVMSSGIKNAILFVRKRLLIAIYTRTGVLVEFLHDKKKEYTFAKESQCTDIYDLKSIEKVKNWKQVVAATRRKRECVEVISIDVTSYIYVKTICRLFLVQLGDVV